MTSGSATVAVAVRWRDDGSSASLAAARVGWAKEAAAPA
jgi:hypothetical protein